GNVPANSPSRALPERSRIFVAPEPDSVIRYVSLTDAMPARLSTAVCGFAAGTVTDTAFTNATSLPLPNTPSPPLRSSVNVVVSTVVALSCRSNATEMDAGSVLCVEPGSGDSDVTRIGPLFSGRSFTAPFVIQDRIASIVACGNAGKPAGIRSPTEAL